MGCAGQWIRYTVEHAGFILQLLATEYACHTGEYELECAAVGSDQHFCGGVLGGAWCKVYKGPMVETCGPMNIEGRVAANHV